MLNQCGLTMIFNLHRRHFRTRPLGRAMGNSRPPTPKPTPTPTQNRSGVQCPLSGRCRFERRGFSDAATPHLGERRLPEVHYRLSSMIRRCTVGLHLANTSAATLSKCKALQQLPTVKNGDGEVKLKCDWGRTGGEPRTTGCENTLRHHRIVNRR
jgi:hypothetical protein